MRLKRPAVLNIGMTWFTAELRASTSPGPTRGIGRAATSDDEGLPPRFEFTRRNGIQFLEAPI